MHRTLLLWLLFVAAAGVLAEAPIPRTLELQQRAAQNGVQCGTTHALDQLTVERILLTDRVATIDAHDRVQCFMRCMIRESDVSDADGRLHHEKFIATMIAYGQNERLMRERLADCQRYYDVNGECRTAWNMYLCFNGFAVHSNGTSTGTESAAVADSNK